MKLKVLFLVPYPLGKSPSQRFRFEQYFHFLKEKGIEHRVSTFLNLHNWQLFYRPGKPVLKFLALTSGFFKRILDLFIAPFYDFIFIHRETTPIGPPVMEWILARIYRKKIIYDFDDAIWLTDKQQESFILRLLKWRGKVKFICKWSYAVSCSNDYLRSYALSFNSRVIHNPTTIDTENLHNPSLYSWQKSDQYTITIGWTGSHSTLKYLYTLRPVIEAIQTEYPYVSLTVIADREPDFVLPKLKFIPWSTENEIKDLLTFDIGIMPLTDDEWTQGKGGFKCLQYMALKIPAIASPVGINSKILIHGVEGFLARSHEEWKHYLTQLVIDSALRLKMGEAGRKRVEANYSITSNSYRFLSLFE